ncbi:hypothetical protein MMC29_007085 [Sticta canariensis]|nr:hypothetical protein [Sticta canariensis]
MDPPRRSSDCPNATPLEVQPATNPPQGSSSAGGNPPKVRAISIQGLSTASESETIIGSPEEGPSAENNVAWDDQAYSIVICLSYFGCRVRIIHDALQAYGFPYSLRAVIARLHRYKLLNHGKVRPPTNGRHISVRTSPSGAKSTLRITVVNAEPTSIKYQCDRLQARTPLYLPLICNEKGRKIIVILSKGRFLARVSDNPDPVRNQLLMDARAECQTNELDWETWEACETYSSYDKVILTFAD